MKRFLALTTAALLTVSALSTTALAANSSTTGVKLVVNGEAVDFTGDQEPVIKDGRTLVPFRAAFEKMGAKVNWFEDTRYCEASYGDFNVGIAIGSNEVNLGDGQDIESDVPAQIINGRTMVPLRVLSESIGATVDWDNATRTVTVSTPKIVGSVPATVTYEEKTATVTGKVSKVTYTYPVVKDVYTAADLLNKNIEKDITTVAQSIADENAIGGDITITLDVKSNDSGIFGIMYLIDGEAVEWAYYGVANAARFTDESYYEVTNGGDHDADDERFTYEDYQAMDFGANGSSAINATVFYPQFSGDEDFIASLNTQLENSAKKDADSFIASYKDEAIKLYDSTTHSDDEELAYNYVVDCNVHITSDNIANIDYTVLTNTVNGKSLLENEDGDLLEVISINLETGEVVE
jgi:hypothetical protein